jgi:predicted NAD/FAD-dependent oxidoreductase
MEAEVLVIGAGVSGLTCAGRLVEAGRRVLVLEKSRGVGGRCATRRVDGIPVDHGITFYHGNDDALRAALDGAGRDRVVAGWPRLVRGTGPPCQPGAFREGDWRLAYSNGVTAFPKSLATGVDVRLSSRVATVEPAAGRWRVVDERGGELTARDLVLAVPAPQALTLLGSWRRELRELESLRSLVREVGFVPALTVIALYPAGGPTPEWEMWYPEDSASLQLVSHDSSKRQRPDRTALVMQALPVWSRKQWERPEAEWRAAMLEEAGRLAGSWAARPETVETHRWRFARIGSGGDLSGPMLITLPEGCRLGVAGDGFSPGGGVQAAWRSGRQLALRLSEDRAT